jgi:hypothetical protein
MKRATAAAYCDLSPAEFDKAVASGSLSLGFALGRSLHWSQVTIDEHLDRLSGDAVPDWRERSPLYNPALRVAQGRKRGLATTEDAKAHLLKMAGGKTGPKLKDNS